MNGNPFGRTMIYLSNGPSCMILSHGNQMGCSKQAFTVLKGMESPCFWVTMTGGAADPEETLSKIGSFHA